MQIPHATPLSLVLLLVGLCSMPLELIRLLPVSVVTPAKTPRVQTWITQSQWPFITSRPYSVRNSCSRTWKPLIIPLPPPPPTMNAQRLKKRWNELRKTVALKLLIHPGLNFQEEGNFDNKDWEKDCWETWSSRLSFNLHLLLQEVICPTHI